MMMKQKKNILSLSYHTTRSSPSAPLHHLWARNSTNNYHLMGLGSTKNCSSISITRRWASSLPQRAALDQLRTVLETEIAEEEDTMGQEFPDIEKVKEVEAPDGFTIIEVPNNGLFTLVRDDVVRITVDLSDSDMRTSNGDDPLVEEEEMMDRDDDPYREDEEGGEEEMVVVEEEPEGIIPFQVHIYPSNFRPELAEGKTVESVAGDETGAELDDREGESAPALILRCVAHQATEEEEEEETITHEDEEEDHGSVPSLSIESMTVESSSYENSLMEIDADLHSAYPPPPFEDLDPRVQEAVWNVLEAYGINDDMAEFICDFAELKESVEYLNYLRHLKDFTTNAI